MAQDFFTACVVGECCKKEPALLLHPQGLSHSPVILDHLFHFGSQYGPSGEGTCHFHYVLLGVATVHAKSVEFHEFTGVVFVETFFAPIESLLKILLPLGGH